MLWSIQRSNSSYFRIAVTRGLSGPCLSIALDSWAPGVLRATSDEKGPELQALNDYRPHGWVPTTSGWLAVNATELI